MINFRFHLASLIAVFLALAIGIVMGSTVIKEATVDVLRSQIHRVERTSNARERTNDQLRGQIDNLDDYLRQSAPYTVRGTLAGVTVAVVAVRGVDGGATKATAQLIQQAGGFTPGILWLEPTWALKNAADARKLGALLGEPDAPARRIRDDAINALARRLSGSESPALASVTRLAPTTTTVAPAGAGGPDLLSELVDAGFLSLEDVGGQAGKTFTLADFPGTTARVLLVTGTDGSVDTTTLVEPLARALVTAKVPTAVASVYHDQQGKPGRSSVLAPIRSDGTLSRQVSTVDDLDLGAGQVASVLALGELETRIGHYGYGDGSTAILPPAQGS